MLRKLAKVLLSVFLFFLLLAGALTLLGYFYQDRIAQFILGEVNKSIDGEFKVNHTTATLVEHFPDITLHFHQVSLAHKDTTRHEIIQLEKVETVFNLWQVMKGNYPIKKVYLKNGQIMVHVDSLNQANFKIFKKKEKEEDSPFDLSLKEVHFDNVRFVYKHDLRPKKIDLLLLDIYASVKVDSAGISGNLKGDIFSDGIAFKPGAFLDKKFVDADINFEYSKKNNTLIFHPSKVIIGKEHLTVHGMVYQQHLRLLIHGEQVNLFNTMRMLPKKFHKAVDSLESNGVSTFDLLISGSLKPYQQPTLVASFQALDISLYRFNKPPAIHHLHFDGAMIQHKDTSYLYLHDIGGDLQGEKLYGDLLITHFAKPFMDLQLRSNMDLSNIWKFIPSRRVEESSGFANIELTYKGALSYLLGDSTSTPDIKGFIELKDAQLKLQSVAFPFDKINGKFILDNNHATVKDFYVQRGRSSMILEGKFRNLLPAIFSDKALLSIDAAFTSPLIHYDDFTSYEHKSKSEKMKAAKKITGIEIPGNVSVVLKGKVQKLVYKKLNATSGDVQFSLIKKTIRLSNSFNTLQGRMKSQFIINASNLKHLRISSNFQLHKIDLNSFFKTFDNFGQNLLSDKNLYGKLSANLRLQFTTDQYLKPDSSTFYGELQYTIDQGRLVDFEPMMKVSNFLFRNRDFSNIHFDRLSSTIYIEKSHLNFSRTIIVSDVLYLYLSGYYINARYLDLKLLLPIRNLKKKFKPEELHNDSRAGLSVPLRATGPPGDIKVKLDK